MSMPTFFSRIIPEQVEVIKAIDKLQEVTDLDTVKRTYAHAIHRELKEAWAKGLGLKQSSGRVCIHRLIGKRCSFYENQPCLPPRTDHPSLWLKDGKPFCLVSQPYGPLVMSDVEAIEKFCHRHGLEFEINSWPGWYFPHAVLFMTFKKK
jgi:hypothetical protein